jgi:hypothetical protein
VNPHAAVSPDSVKAEFAAHCSRRRRCSAFGWAQVRRVICATDAELRAPRVSRRGTPNSRHSRMVSKRGTASCDHNTFRILSGVYDAGIAARSEDPGYRLNELPCKRIISSQSTTSTQLLSPYAIAPCASAHASEVGRILPLNENKSRSRQRVRTHSLVLPGHFRKLDLEFRVPSSAPKEFPACYGR